MLASDFLMRPNKKCPCCGSQERHRSQFIYLSEFLEDDSMVLEVAPDNYVSKRLDGRRGIRYVTTDVDRARPVSHFYDVCELPWLERFDVVVCCHVLEHVCRDLLALEKIYRALVPDGWGLIQIPIWAVETFGCDSESAEDRERLFGHPDHVRRYGRDFRDIVSRAGFRVEEIPVAGLGDCNRLGCDPNEILYKVMK